MENDNDSFNLFSSINATTNIRQQRHRSSSLSNVPALRITTTPIITAVDTSTTTGPVLAESESEPKFNHPQYLTKKQTELAKLFAHHLSRLKERPQAPSVFLPLRAASETQKSLPKLSVVADSVRAAVRLKSHVQPQYQASFIDPDDTLTSSAFSVFSTEIACDYLVQLRDLLNVSEKQGVHVLNTSDIDSTITPRGRATVRRIKSSPQRPRSLSASSSDHPHRIELLHECIEILRTVISEDARFKNHSFRPTRPPYSLQAVVLDIAHILITIYRHDPATLSRIGFALIPAFYSFDPILHPRLFQFFESGIIRYMLDELHVWRGMEPVMKSPAPYDNNSGPRLATRMTVPDSLQVPSQNQGWVQHLSPVTPSTPSLSAIAPLQSLTIYQLSSLIPPLLAALLQVVDPTTDEKNPTKLYKFYSLLDTIVFLKEDAYLDVLEVIAYNDSPTRHRALSVLATYWPRAVGHAIYGRELPVLSYQDVVLFPNRTQGAHAHARLLHPPMRDEPYTHEFIPWRFDSSPGSKHDAFCQACHVCGGSMSGFALLCPFCFIFVHFSCYDHPHGTHAGQYVLPSSDKKAANTPAEPKPCLFSYSHILPLRRNIEPEVVKSGQHAFRMVNLFTLTLCMVCNTPLWGHTRQGFKCKQCNVFVHPSCARNVTNGSAKCAGESAEDPSVHTLIEFSALERTFMEFYRPILFGSKSLEGKQYEEVSIYYSILSAQLFILDNGINCKSIVLQENKRLTMTPMQSFALHKYCAAYAQYLASPMKAPLSSAMQEYIRFNDLSLEKARCILFDWTLLAGITSVLKAPLRHHLTFGSAANSNSLSPFNDGRQSEKEMLADASHPYELAGLSHLRNVLSYEFHVHTDAAVEYMLNHIRQIGFFERVGEQTDLFTTSDATKDPLCAFSLPLGLDLSTGVETLVVAIQACLEDINIAVNEYGFLLLTRRFPPTGAASDYALNRLTRILFSWIISEDERLLILARDYIGRGLPGVRTLSEKQPWPLSASFPLSTSTFTAARLGNAAINSGGEYLFCRRQLLNRHALPWLAAVYELDPVAYANFVFEFCVDVGDRADSALIENILFEKGNKEWKALEAASKAQRAEAAFRSVNKLTQAGVLLSTFDQIITRWLDLFVSLESDNNIVAVKALSRLFHRDHENTRRSSSIPDPNPSQSNSSSPANDPWAVIMDVMSSGLEGFERASRWLRVMSRSGVDIPDENILRILELAVDLSAPLSLVVLSLESIVVFSWSKLLGEDGLISKLLHVCEVWIDRIIDDMKDGAYIDLIADFLRYTLVMHLLWYGCSREVIKGTGLVSPDLFPAISQQRRRVYSRYNADSHVLNADHSFIKLLTRIAVDGPEDICIIVAKFLSALVSDSSHIDSQGIDNFILQNGKALAQCAWSFYGLETPEASVLRITFLLRLLVVESRPLENLVNNELRLDDKWQVRFQAAAKLFRVLLDVNSPTFEIAGRQWGLSVSDFFIQFFSSLWLDPAEEVRLAVDVWARTLLPSHLKKITMCWDEYMTKAPLADSVKLVASLVQLHPHFPSWKVLSWEAITEVYNQTYEDEAAYGGTVDLAVVDENVVSLRLSLITLALQMLNEKMDISLNDLVQIKFMTVRFLGFSSARRVPTPNGQLLYVQLGDMYEVNGHACNIIQPLLRLLDTSYKLRLPASLLGHWTQDFEDGLLGNLFVDVILKIWEDPHPVQRLSYVPMRGLLESLIVIIVKHDLSSSILKHLDEPMCTAIKTVTDLILLNSNYELQQLCFAILFLFLKTYPVLALRILSYQLNALSSLSSSEEYLLTRTKEFIEAAFVQYEVAGLFWLLSKSGHMETNFLRLLTAVEPKNSDAKKKSIHDVILRDTLSQVSASITDPVVANALHNLDKCVTMSEGHSYSDAVVQHFCFRLATIVRQINDTSPFGSKIHWDPKPLLSIATTIFERKDPPYFDILEHVDSLLRASLPKCDISAKVLLRIIDCTMKSPTGEFNSWTARLCHTMLDVLSDALRGKTRMSSSNLIAIIEVIKSVDIQRDARIQIPTLVRVGVDAISYFSLGHEASFTASDFQAYIAVAKLILSVTNVNSSFIGQVMSGENKNPMPIRVWNLLTLATIEHADPAVAWKLFDLLPTFSIFYTITLRFANQGHYDQSALAVNHAFASVKLWLLLARVCHATTKYNQRNEESDRAERQVWNALWPPFESLLVQTSDNPNGEVPPLLTFVRGCATDLILFVRQTHSAVSFDSSSHISILKSLRAHEVGGKFNRALRSISEPPLEADFETLRSQVANDVFTAEKLHAVDAIRQGLERRRENTSNSRTT